MTKNLLTILSFLIFGICFSQKEITGKIVFGDLNLKDIEVINYNSKKIAITNELGEFKILANPNDELIILTEKYFNKTIIVSRRMFTEKTIIYLSEKPVELDEVTVSNKTNFKVETDYNAIKMGQIQNAQSRPKNDAVYTGEIVNGVDFVQIGRMIGKLFKSKKKTKPVENKITFKDYSANNFTSDFYTKTLELKPDQVSAFIEYCEADPKAKEVIKTDDEFTILDFLISKKTEFVKI